MDQDEIAEIGVKEKSLYLKPSTKKFPYIYREAMGVKWDPTLNTLSMLEDRNWEFIQCFQQIIAAAREQACHLRIGTHTRWVNVSDELKKQILGMSR